MSTPPRIWPLEDGLWALTRLYTWFYIGSTINIDGDLFAVANLLVSRLSYNEQSVTTNNNNKSYYC